MNQVLNLFRLQKTAKLLISTYNLEHYTVEHNNKAHFRQHMPSFMDFKSIEFDFNTMDELLKHEIFQEYTKPLNKHKPFDRWFKRKYNKEMIIGALYKDGTKWVIGYLSNCNKLDWTGIDDLIDT